LGIDSISESSLGNDPESSSRISPSFPSGIAVEKQLQSTRGLFQKKLIKWAKKNLRSFPWRRKTTPYRVLIAEVLLKRTTAQAVLRVYGEFIRSYPNIRTLVGAEQTRLRELLQKIGLQERRASALIKIANHIVMQFGGRIPDSRENLLKIPHVGPYTANAVLALGYNIPTAMVDSNVERVIRRVFSGRLPPKASQSAIQDTANFLAPRSQNRIYNLALIDLGALVCRYDFPRCRICPVSSHCDSCHRKHGRKA